MRVGLRRAVLIALGTAAFYLSGVPEATGQPARHAAAVPKSQLAEEVFKDIRLLKGISVDEFMDTMGFFSASTNLNCVDCHGAASGGDWAHYADETPMKATARRMILLMQRIDRDLSYIDLTAGCLFPFGHPIFESVAHRGFQHHHVDGLTLIGLGFEKRDALLGNR